MKSDVVLSLTVTPNSLLSSGGAYTIPISPMGKEVIPHCVAVKSKEKNSTDQFFSHKLTLEMVSLTKIPCGVIMRETHSLFLLGPLLIMVLATSEALSGGREGEAI